MKVCKFLEGFIEDAGNTIALTDGIEIGFCVALSVCIG
jgi:hypothetical protein